MNRLKPFIILAIFFCIAGCSTMSASKQAVNLSSITADKTYQLRVRSGNIALDKIIYDYALMKFGGYLRIAGGEPFNSHIEIVFMSTLSKSHAGYTTNMSYENSWYTGNDAPWLNNYYPASGTEITPGGIFSRQNSIMTVIIKDTGGQKFWKTIYSYKGGSELSGIYVKTADEAARISLDRIINQFEKDFIFIPKVTGYAASDIMPGIALVVEKPSGPGENIERNEKAFDKK